MLRILREHATSWMLRGILILVAVTFISWGGYSLIRERKVTYAAKVNGTSIDMKEYFDAYEGTVKQYRDALGSSFSEKMIEELKIKDRIMDDLIARVLILQEGERLGLNVGDQELREAIESIPSFQINGQFDPRTYERFLRLNRMNPEGFERLQRDRLLMTKVVNLIRLNGGNISDDEVLEMYRFDNERINLSFVKVSPPSFRGQVTTNEIEEKDYYQNHQEEFRIPTTMQIQYLTFRSSDYEGRVQVTPDDIRRTYEAQKGRFTVPKRVKAREILIKVSPEDPADKIDEQKKRAEEILEKAKKAKDFAAVARQFSESESASKGGDIGWVQRGTRDESVETALFAMKPGEVSGLVNAQAGFTILKVEEILEEQQKSLEEVREQILQALRTEKAKAEASRAADDAFYSLFRNRNLEAYAKEKGIPIRTTGFFKEGDEVPEFGTNQTFQTAAFSLKAGEISPVVTLAPNFYLLKCVDKKESRIPSFEEVKEKAKQKVIEVKSDEKARQGAEDLLRQVESGKSVREAAQEKGLQVEETGWFTRTGGMVPRIGPSGQLMPFLSSLTEKNPVSKEIWKTKDGYFVVKLLSREPADESKFPSAKKDLEKRLIYQKAEQTFRNWLDQLKAKAKIEINQSVTKG
jgi:peptidyl-prolyl cis-trans isomerase D